MHYSVLRAEPRFNVAGERQVGKLWISYGRTPFPGFSIGIELDRYHFSLNLVFWYIGLEF
jgi:hypothetical protein